MYFDGTCGKLNCVKMQARDGYTLTLNSYHAGPHAEMKHKLMGREDIAVMLYKLFFS